MNQSRPLPLWAGRTLALIAIALLALTLRTAVAAISPIFGEIEHDIPLSSILIGVLGMLPPILFAASGFITPLVTRRLGLELAVVVALLLMVVGHLLRAFAPNYAVLAIGSILALLGMGFGNVLMPPIVRRYFPDRIGLLTSGYISIMTIGATAPPLIAAPLAESVGWRFSLAIWAVVCAFALVPWLILLARHRRSVAAALADETTIETPRAAVVGRLWTSRVAIAITLTLSASTISMYAGFAWLPEIITDLTGASQSQAGLYLSLFSVIGLVGAIVVPTIVTRSRNVAWIVLFGVGLFVVGYVGLLVAPAVATPLWVICIGSGPLLFPVSLVLINSRTRTHQGAIAVSGFAQGIGYSLGAVGPLLVGILHDASGGWTAPLVFLLCSTGLGIFGAVMLAKPRYVEDELNQAA